MRAATPRYLRGNERERETRVERTRWKCRFRDITENSTSFSLIIIIIHYWGFLLLNTILHGAWSLVAPWQLKTVSDGERAATLSSIRYALKPNKLNAIIVRLIASAYVFFPRVENEWRFLVDRKRGKKYQWFSFTRHFHWNWFLFRLHASVSVTIKF